MHARGGKVTLHPGFRGWQGLRGAGRHGLVGRERGQLLQFLKRNQKFRFVCHIFHFQTFAEKFKNIIWAFEQRWAELPEDNLGTCGPLWYLCFTVRTRAHGPKWDGPPLL